MELLEDFKHGPLDVYRKRASFHWKKLKIYLEGEDVIRYKNELVNVLKSDPLFDPNDDSKSFQEIREQAYLRVRALSSHPAFAVDHFIANFANLAGNFEVVFSWDPSVGVTFGLKLSLFSNVIKTLGTEEHMPIAEASDDNKIVGCFTLTEIGHGSNTKLMQTRATYEKETRTFLIHTPHFEAAKCWSGLLGQNATHTVLYAQLFTPDGVCHGLHQFVVQIRDVRTHMPLPGVVIADMGPKGGLNGIDNGVMLFNQYRVPKSALLNRHVDVTEEGVYVPRMVDPKKRFGASLHALSVGRINITCICSTLMTKAVSIAVRYAAVRKQFGPENRSPEDEVPILEYQLHQYRLLPYVASAIVTKVFSYFLVADNVEAQVEKFMGMEKADCAERGIEMHAISSACKPFAAWLARDAIQEAREACGGHGYLKAARLVEIRGDNDANITYEGENHVLIQQTSNWLLKLWSSVLAKESVAAPYASITFLSHSTTILSKSCDAKCVDEMLHADCIFSAYRWLVCHLLRISYDRQQDNIARGQNTFDAKNNNQVFHAKDLSLVYIQHFFLLRFKMAMDQSDDASIRQVLERVFALFGLFHLEKHIGHLYQGGYFVGARPRILLQNAILHLCASLKDDAVALIDAIAPDDFLMNSALGQSDGQVYNNIQTAILTGTGSMSRPKWWREIISTKTSKL